jgi:hypothetical protein
LARAWGPAFLEENGMETYQMIALAGAAVVLVLYLLRRRSRLNRED